MQNHLMALSLILFSVLGGGLQAVAQDLGDFRWKRRVLLLCNPDKTEGQTEKQLALFEGREREAAERDMLILQFDGMEIKDVLGQPTRISPEGIPDQKYNGVVLLGKDGGVKLKAPFLVQPEEIFELIDSMPMRQAEMRSSKKD